MTGKRTRLLALALGLSACGEPSKVEGPNPPAWTAVTSSMGSAEIIYSNFGPSMEFDTDPTHGWTINGFLGPGIGQQAISQQFTPSADYRFSEANVALALFAGPSSFRVFVQSQVNGLPGEVEVLEAISIGGVGPTPAVFTASSTEFPVLHKGRPYWLTVTAGADGVVGGWYWNSVGDVSLETRVVTQGGGPTGPWWWDPSPAPRSAFQVSGVPFTPKDAIQLLIEDVKGFISDGMLNQGQAQGLINKLVAAIESLNAGRPETACYQIRAFVLEVNALLKAGALSDLSEFWESVGWLLAQIPCPAPPP